MRVLRLIESLIVRLYLWLDSHIVRLHMFASSTCLNSYSNK